MNRQVLQTRQFLLFDHESDLAAQKGRASGDHQGSEAHVPLFDGEQLQRLRDGSLHP